MIVYRTGSKIVTKKDKFICVEVVGGKMTLKITLWGGAQCSMGVAHRYVILPFQGVVDFLYLYKPHALKGQNLIE
jgi:hypothetical protein